LKRDKSEDEELYINMINISNVIKTINKTF